MQVIWGCANTVRVSGWHVGRCVVVISVMSGAQLAEGHSFASGPSESC
jgi:hypothetical protein